MNTNQRPISFIENATYKTLEEVIAETVKAFPDVVMFKARLTELGIKNDLHTLNRCHTCPVAQYLTIQCKFPVSVASSNAWPTSFMDLRRVVPLPHVLRRAVQQYDNDFRKSTA
jgi:hypothetical protein